MSPILFLLLIITALFIVLLVGKGLFKLRFCVICLSISLTWVALLIMFWLGKFDHPVLIGVLVGQSVVGVYYLLEKKTPEDMHVFRLPFLLTATFVAYALLGEVYGSIFPVVGLLGVVWGILLVAYATRSNKKARKMVDKIIACCRDW